MFGAFSLPTIVVIAGIYVFGIRDSYLKRV